MWIVDASQDKAFFYEDAADLTSGSRDATRSFDLHSDNFNASGLEVFGGNLWVTDASSDRVFIYSTSGEHLGDWALDPENSNSSGITTDSTGQHLWVSDLSDGRVYYYENATDQLSGSLAATSSFQLTGQNDRPEGIADPVESIAYGDTVVNSISTGTEVDDFIFNGTAGDLVTFDFLSLTGGSLRAQLIAPDGSTVFNTLGSTASILESNIGAPRSLSQTGSYTLRLTSTNGTSTPSYSFNLVNSQVTTTTVAIGDVINDSIIQPGDTNTYSFASTGTETLFLDGQLLSPSSFSTITIRLVAPNGDVVLSDAGSQANFLDNGPINLDQIGDYSLEVSARGTATPVYQFELVDVPDTIPVAIGIGDVVSGEIAVAGEVDVYEFVSDGTNRVFFDFLSVDALFQQLSTQLIDPNGEVVFTDSGQSQGFLDNGPFLLDIPGTYQYVVDGGGGDTVTGYSFDLVDVPAPNVRPLVFDTVNSGDITVRGAEDQFIITPDFVGQVGFLSLIHI